MAAELEPIEPEGRGLDQVAQIRQTLAALLAADDAEVMPTAGAAAEAVRWAELARVAFHQDQAGTAMINTATVFKIRAGCRLADLVDAGQEAGQIARPGRPPNIRDPHILMLDDLGLTAQRLAEARRVRERYGAVNFAEWARQLTDDGEVISWDRATRPGAHVGQNSGVSEWYSPAEYVGAAVAVLGALDLDPATTDVANEVVGADRIYTADDDGLAPGNPWAGRVWMNPPYSQPAVAAFALRLVGEFTAGNVTAAITLTNNATETAWWQEMAAAASALCLPAGRVKFWHPERLSAPLQGQALLYLGPYPGQFSAEFGRFGSVWEHAPR